MNCLSICSVTVKSAITPSFIGRMTVMVHRRLAKHFLGFLPTAWMVLALGPPSRRMATTKARRERWNGPRNIDQRVCRAKVDGQVV